MARTLIKEIKDTRQNYLINGNFDIWQRGVSATSGAIVYATADRWWHYGDFTTWSISQVSDTTNGSRYAMRISLTTLGVGTELDLAQPLETSLVRSLQGKTVTLSCLLKPNASYTGSINLIVKWGTGTDERNPTGGASLTKNVLMSSLSTSQYTQVTSTVTIPSNATSLAVTFHMPAASIQAGSTIDIKNVMLNEGSTAAPFKLFGNTIDGEIAACQRYYSKNFELTTAPTASTSKWIIYQFPVAIPNTGYLPAPTFFPHEMRAIPVVTLYGGEGIGNAGNIYVNGVSRAASVERISTNMFSRVYNGSGVTWNINEQIIFNWTADAEL